jgi:phage protein D
MANDAAQLLSRFRATVNGRDISPALAPVLMGIRIRDAAGQASDTAEIQLDDRAGSIVLPKARARLQVELRDRGGLGLAFVGLVDEVRSRGDRTGGRILTISAKGADVLGRAKQLQERHFDDATIGEALAAAGEAAGISTVRIDPTLAALRRSYIALEGESFLAFGQRLARELGGTFKVVGDRALLVKRNGGTTASGRALATIKAEYGRNLLDWDIAPFVSRPRHKKSTARHYDPDAAELQAQSATLADESTDAEQVGRYMAADAAEAQDQANASAGEIERSAGAGSISIECDTRAKPEGVCSVVGVRAGVDGDYRIDAVEHSLDRSGGSLTRLDLGQPHGSAGKDGRKPAAPKAPLQTLSFEEN